MKHAKKNVQIFINKMMITYVLKSVNYMSMKQIFALKAVTISLTHTFNKMAADIAGHVKMINL